MRKSLFLLGILLSAIMQLVAQPNLKLYYGLLHSHTAFSDGSGTPEEAYTSAKTEKLDFFAVTPHNHADAEAGAKERKDGVLIANDHDLYNGTSQIHVTQNFPNGTTRSFQAKSVISAAKGITSSTFLGVYGQEFSTISSGNHMNVFNVDEVLVNPNGNFNSLFTTLTAIKNAGNPPPVVQLNHPDVQADLFYAGNDVKTKKKMFNDYGIDVGDLGPDFKDWVEAVDEFVSLIEILSGPAMDKKIYSSYKYKDANENDYYFYLTQGLHISPSAGQDNHYPNWGTGTPARTGVFAKSLAKDDLLDGLRNNRTFATEDKNMDIRFWINDHFMGEKLIVNTDDELQVKLSVNDIDEPNTTYEAFLVSGTIEPETSTQATRVLASDGVVQTLDIDVAGINNFSPLVATDKEMFFYVKIEQIDGDRAWSAPIWVSPTGIQTASLSEGSFCWTAGSSRYYHRMGCSSAKLIKPENLRTGNQPPESRILHDCTVVIDESDH